MSSMPSMVQKMFITSTNYFKPIDDNTTEWISECEFLFQGFMMKTMAFLMPGAFKKQSLKFMKDFKAFVEDATSVAKS